MIAHRSTKDGPFCWASKAALRRILDKTGENEKATQRARTVYLALCELASDAGSERIIAAKTLIAFRAGISVRSVQRAFPDLVGAGVLMVEHDAQGVGSQSAYSLLSTPGHVGLPPSHNGHPPSQTEFSVWPTRYKELKELKEPCAPAKPPRARNALLDALAAVDGSDPAQVTGTAWGAIAKALKEVQAVCPHVTPAEIARRAGNYRKHMPDATISPLALAKHWAKCDHPPQTAAAMQQLNHKPF